MLNRSVKNYKLYPAINGWLVELIASQSDLRYFFYRYDQDGGIITTHDVEKASVVGSSGELMNIARIWKDLETIRIAERRALVVLEKERLAALEPVAVLEPVLAD